MGRAALRSLPTNMTDTTRVLLRLDGSLRNEMVGGRVVSLSVESALPVRQFFAWPGKRNYEGSWWSSTNGSHVQFESLLEREYLLAADFDTEIVAIAAQPLAFLWPHGVKGQRSHVPDFFARLDCGDGRLVDVRHPEHVERNAAQFDMTREACSEAGWQYEVFTGLPQVVSLNLRWLAGYRQDRCAPAGEVAVRICEGFGEPVSLTAGLRRICKSTGLPKEMIMANTLNLLWRRRLSADLTQPLSMDSEVRA